MFLAISVQSHAAKIPARSCSQADVQAAINAASTGDTVLVPAGTATWTSRLTLSKGIHLRGNGGGGFVGHSRTSLAIGTGAKTFTTQAGLGFQADQTVQAICIANGTRFMEGAVTSYYGTTLQMNVIAIGGSGIITGNVMADMKSQIWGDCDEIQMIVMSLRRNCLYAGHAYPVPRPVGQGHDGKAQILDPLCIWNNPGNPRIGMNDYEPDEVGRGLHTADCIMEGRDYHVGSAKPGYASYPHPHPLRTEPLPGH